MYDMKYNNDLDKYAKQHKLYISNELVMNECDVNTNVYKLKPDSKKRITNFIKNHPTTAEKEGVFNHVIVKWKDITIIDIKTKGIINDDELLKLIKREINLIELGV